MAIQTATFGAGCFWGVEWVFLQVPGVIDVVSGYSGGFVENPSYEEVCTDNTGHAEVVQVTFDPSAISYRDILQVYFSIHDPTTPNRQGADIGTQYRSVIFHHSDTQRATAEQTIRELTEAKLWDAPIVTQLEPLKTFYPAEMYHQEYFSRNASQPYCMAVVAPKVAKFRKQHLARLKDTAAAR